VGASALGLGYLLGPREHPQITSQTVSATKSATSYSSASATSTLNPTKLKQGYPLLGNYDHWTWDIEPNQLELFARWDRLALNFETAHRSTDALRHIRELNPNTKILAWISLGYWDLNTSNQGYLGRKFLNSSTEAWWIHDKGTGDRIHLTSWYPDLVTPNPQTGFADHLLEFVHDDILSTSLYDGVFYDGCGWDSGLAERLSNADVSISAYRLGITDILKRTRHNESGDVIILGNPGVQWDDDASYWDYANGHYQENALGDVFGSNWNAMWKIYERNMMKRSPPPRFHWIGVDTQYKRKRPDYLNVTQQDLTADDLRRMRLGLGTTLLLDNGYFGFDKGDGWHGYGDQWGFPEYDAKLGFPSMKYEQDNGLYKRVFENGTVFVNSTNVGRTVQMSEKFKDATSGSIGTVFLIDPMDSRILMKS
jgi:hypothetical protein